MAGVQPALKQEEEAVPLNEFKRNDKLSPTHPFHLLHQRELGWISSLEASTTVPDEHYISFLFLIVVLRSIKPFPGIDCNSRVNPN